VPPVADWAAWFEELVVQRRATRLAVGDAAFWVCAERLELALMAYPSAVLSPALAAAAGMPVPERADVALSEIVRGWLESSGPVTVSELKETLAADESSVVAALLRLESEGQVLRGRFRGLDEEEWCNRRVLARIHRLTIGQLRREIEPVPVADYARFLHRWQHVAPSSRLHGLDGVLQIVRQLEGYEIPAAAWETHILPRRISGYKREYLDQLCYSGDVMWGRVSRHPALVSEGEERTRRVRPTKLAPISLFMRADAGELIVRDAYQPESLSHAAREVLAEIERRGAPFFAEIVRGTKRLPSEVEEALWQLVAAGLVTADGFDALRSLIDAKRRLGVRGLRARPRSSSGRWTLLTSETASVDADGFARRLLRRWGVVFRDVVARESITPRWREVLVALRRMEARGEVRGGRFVATVLGEQFALPDAIDALRAARRDPQGEVPVDVSPYDPLQIVAAFMPGRESRVAALAPAVAT
jgi:ATP-dependent Lhr-like helicase